MIYCKYFLIIMIFYFLFWIKSFATDYLDKLNDHMDLKNLKWT